MMIENMIFFASCRDRISNREFAKKSKDCFEKLNYEKKRQERKHNINSQKSKLIVPSLNFIDWVIQH